MLPFRFKFGYFIVMEELSSDLFSAASSVAQIVLVLIVVGLGIWLSLFAARLLRYAAEASAGGPPGCNSHSCLRSSDSPSQFLPMVQPSLIDVPMKSDGTFKMLDSKGEVSGGFVHTVHSSGNITQVSTDVFDAASERVNIDMHDKGNHSAYDSADNTLIADPTLEYRRLSNVIGDPNYNPYGNSFYTDNEETIKTLKTFAPVERRDDGTSFVRDAANNEFNFDDRR